MIFRITSQRTWMKTALFFVLAFLLAVPGGGLLSRAMADECLAIDDIPVDTQLDASPPNLFFLIDDSGSMDWEFMTTNSDGRFDGGIEYLYSHSDNFYGTSSSLGEILGVTDSTRAKWKATWHEYNRLYYNPEIEYVPWWKTDVSARMDNASTTNPKSNPMLPDSTNIRSNLDDTWFSVQVTSSSPSTVQKIAMENPQAYHDVGTSTCADAIRYRRSGTSSWTYIDNIVGDNYEQVGDWRNSSGHNYYGNKSVYLRYGGSNDHVAWIPDIPASGDYEVQIKWTVAGTRNSAVTYTIYYNGGNSTQNITVNQRNSYSWYDLGTYYFEAQEANGGGSSLNVPYAHYYTWYDADSDGTQDTGEIYLVILSDPITYYQLNGDNDTTVEDNELSLVEDADVPEAIKADRYEWATRDSNPVTPRQNFANWFQYYRRRSLAAISAISEVIANLRNMYVGMGGFNALQSNNRRNEGIIEPVQPVHVQGQDSTAHLLEVLYDYDQISGQASTPMRAGLMEVGQYFHTEQGNQPSDKLGTSPLSEDAGSACGQNFVVIFTDGYYNGGAPGVQNVDNTIITNDSGTRISGVDPYKDGSPNSLADTAMYFYAYDIAPNIENVVPTMFPDLANHQHLVTYCITFGVHGNLNPEDYDLYGANPSYPTWPNLNAGNDSRKKIDDMWHASVNGRGEFYSADSPDELIAAFQDMIESIMSRIGAGSAATINNDFLQAGTYIFGSGYNTIGWAGYVNSRAIDEGTGAVSSTIEWEAGAQLETLVSGSGWNTNRKIATYNGTNGVAFRWSSLTTAQKTALDNDENILKYLRGDKTNEERFSVGTFRNRLTQEEGAQDDELQPFTLGDIVHSSPAIQDDVLYVGANDGMLHAFNATNGQEMFAYIPSFVFDHLKNLSQMSYSHKYYVDKTPYIRETDSQTLLVGGLGKGGKGYYCLDITGVTASSNPITSESVLAGKVLWEFPNSSTPPTDTSDVGYSFSDAYIEKSNDSNHPWIVVFGNGYNSTDETAVLFILDALTGSIVKKIDTAAGSCNGLSTPMPVDYNNDRTVDAVYAGDLKGNLWVFDLSDSNSSNWDVAYKNVSTPAPLFTATDANETPQPITARPDVMAHCSSHGYIVVFGTGKYLSGSDIRDNQQQTIYGIWDYGDKEDDGEYLGSFNRSNGRLSNQPASVTLLEQTTITDPNYPMARFISANEADWTTTDDSTDGQEPNPSVHAGWYYDLPAERERVFQDIIIRNGRAIFISTVPEPPDRPCSSGGSSFLQIIDACTGGAPDDASFDTDSSGGIDENDLIEIDNPDYDTNDPNYHDYNDPNSPNYDPNNPNFNPDDPISNPTLSVPQSGMELPGIVFAPSILSAGGVDIAYLTDWSGTTRTQTIRGERLGVILWRQVN